MYECTSYVSIYVYDCIRGKTQNVNFFTAVSRLQFTKVGKQGEENKHYCIIVVFSPS